MQIIWKEKKFKDLSNIELYKILQLRSKIFVVEQNCVYNDLDNLDAAHQVYKLINKQFSLKL